jgi:hypothetical protein
MYISMCEKTEKGPSRHGKKGCKNLNSETSSGIFLNFSLLSIDFQEISGF